jgi:hypothetical protein
LLGGARWKERENKRKARQGKGSGAKRLAVDNFFYLQPELRKKN